MLLFCNSFYTRTLQHQLQDSLQPPTTLEPARPSVNTADQHGQVKRTHLARGDHNAQGPRKGDTDMLDLAAQDQAVL